MGVFEDFLMTNRELYERSKAALLADKTICQENRKLFTEFFRFEEYKLKRIRGNPALDENSYKTLLSYSQRLRTVNRWFQNKSWRSLTKAGIQRVYDDLEDGKILALKSGKPIKDKRTFYKLVIRGKPFEMAGKKDLVREVMQFSPRQDSEEVRFITEEKFRLLLKFVTRPAHRLFLWLCWDIGENAWSILRLRKEDCNRRHNEHLAEPEYLINLRKEILKRSRRPRTELTNYQETVDCLDDHLKKLPEGSLLFAFGAAGGRKILRCAARKAGICCQPGGQQVTLKDLRSSMACDLLSKGWSRDEVNARLGHTPSSRIIDKYINYLAIDRVRPKQKFQDNQISRLSFELAEIRNREKLVSQRLEQLQRTSDARTAHLNGLVGIQSKIVTLLIDRIQRKLTEQEFARALAKCYNALSVQATRPPSLIDSSSHMAQVE